MKRLWFDCYICNRLQYLTTVNNWPLFPTTEPALSVATFWSESLHNTVDPRLSGPRVSGCSDYPALDSIPFLRQWLAVAMSP